MKILAAAVLLVSTSALAVQLPDRTFSSGNDVYPGASGTRRWCRDTSAACTTPLLTLLLLSTAYGILASRYRRTTLRSTSPSSESSDLQAGACDSGADDRHVLQVPEG